MVPALREGQTLDLEPVGGGKPGMVPAGGAAVGGVGSRQSDCPESIGTEKLARVTRLVFHLALEIAMDREAPRWTEEGWLEVQRKLGPSGG